jgi:hypothetical protein
MRIWRVTVLITLGNAVALILTKIAQDNLPASAKSISIESWGIFFTVLGVVYAIIVGFVLAELLSRYHRLSTHIHDELNAIEDIRDYLIYVDHNEDTKTCIVDALYGYLVSVVDREWPAMANAQNTIESDTSPELYGIMEAVEQIKVYDRSDVVALEFMIERISDVTTYRTERLEMSRQHLSPALRFLIVFLSLIVAGGFILMNVGSTLIHGFMVLGAVTSISLLYVVMADLEQPFTGMWNITDAALRKVVERRSSLTTR